MQPESSGTGNQFVLRQKLEDFSAWFFPIVDRFPKREKWALCTQIKNCIYRLMRTAIRMQKSRDKMRHSFEFDIDLSYNNPYNADPQSDSSDSFTVPNAPFQGVMK